MKESLWLSNEANNNNIRFLTSNMRQLEVNWCVSCFLAIGDRCNNVMLLLGIHRMTDSCAVC